MTSVTLSKVPEVKVGNAATGNAVEVDVDDPRGQLEISTGGVKWTPKDVRGKRRTTRSRQVSWRALVELLNEKGRAP